MTAERIQKLEKLGFAWDCRKPKDDDDSSTGAKTSAVQEAKAGANDALAKLANGNARAFPRCEFLSFGSRKFGAPN